jgi:uncharacterized protein YqjF (DUF2071 family)
MRLDLRTLCRRGVDGTLVAMPDEPRGIPFLVAEWRFLVMLNWRVAPELLEPLVPVGTELDTWGGAHYVSVVGFLFLGTRVLGIPIPYHRDFEEVNLRFYVRRVVDGEVRRGVVFVREIVSRRAVASLARLAYNEPYRTLPMDHRIEPGPADGEAPALVEYRWRQPTGWSRIAVEAVGVASPLTDGSEEEFITEHYWGYTRQRDGGTMEYRVTHPRWPVWQVRSAAIEGDLADVYGADLADVLRAVPHSAFLAEGSAIEVHRPRRL